MASGILKNDTCVAKEKCWHGKETIVDKIDYENSGLNWTVERQEILLQKTGKKIEQTIKI